MSLSIHWTIADKNFRTSRYKHRSTFCYNYLLDKTLRENGIYYDPDLSRITETELLITFDYYTRIHRKHRVLQCPVKVKQQRSLLFFMRFKKDGTTADSSYFVLASTSSEIASLYVLMYTTQKVATEREKEPENVPLSSIQEDEVLDEHMGPINFRRIMKVPNKESTGSVIVLFGKAAERVFITSSSFYFINLDLSDWFVDKFIQLMEKMRKGKCIW